MVPEQGTANLRPAEFALWRRDPCITRHRLVSVQPGRIEKYKLQMRGQMWDAASRVRRYGRTWPLLHTYWLSQYSIYRLLHSPEDIVRSISLSLSHCMTLPLAIGAWSRFLICSSSPSYRTLPTSLELYHLLRQLHHYIQTCYWINTSIVLSSHHGILGQS